MGNEIRQKYKKYRLRKIEKYYVKQEKNAGKNRDLMEPGNQNENNGEDNGTTQKIQNRSNGGSAEAKGKEKVKTQTQTVAIMPLRH